MTIQTLANPVPAAIDRLHVRARATAPCVIVAVEGSDLASHLRATGWIARSGWCSHAAGRRSEWLVRFESPVGSSFDAVA